MVAELNSQLAIAETTDMTETAGMTETTGMTETAETADMTNRKLGIWGRRVEMV
ncbi:MULTISPECIES: hypothetical protein [unclassified Nostoc]|uniref:hypothetical protein n=1 Tax=unclassified Nostoc TaxID=2593658 RepID=UPI0026325EA2|nr:hypothetical protein [Nostoc sp. S13]MDF5738429.1 hypothetical protein [Nostoc sp. S13]